MRQLQVGLGKKAFGTDLVQVLCPEQIIFAVKCTNRFFSFLFAYSKKASHARRHNRQNILNNSYIRSMEIFFLESHGEINFCQSVFFLFVSSSILMATDGFQFTGGC